MKYKSTILLTILFFSFFILNAKETSDVSEFSVQVLNSNTIILNIEEVKQGEVSVILKDVKGSTLHKETISGSKARNRKYTLENLPFGKYTLFAEYDGFIKVQPIKKGSEILEIDPSALQTIFKPNFRQASGRLDLNMLCVADFDISLKIKDYDRNVIYSESSVLQGAINKRYNLSQLNDGSYYFIVTIEEGNFKYEFEEVFEINSLVAIN